MTIPANITIALTSLEAQVAAAEPLRNATHPTVTALQLNAANLVASIQAALTTTTIIPNIAPTTDNVYIDTWTAPSDPPTIIAGVLSMLTHAQDQSKLCLMRGVVGRAASNLDQLI